jgi:hypothetical protein
MREGPSLAGYPAGSGSGGALFAETPNGLGADGNSLKNLVRSKVTTSLRKRAGVATDTPSSDL